MRWYPECTTSFKLPYSSDEVISKIQSAAEKTANNILLELELENLNDGLNVNIEMKPSKYVRFISIICLIILIALQIMVLIMAMRNEYPSIFICFVPLILSIYLFFQNLVQFYIACRMRISNLYYDIMGYRNPKPPKIKFKR